MRLKSPILSNNLFYWLFSLLGLHGCGLFSFSGSSLPDDIKTFSIECYTEVSDGPINMPDELTKAFETKILNSTRLTREEKDGDIQYAITLKSFEYKTHFTTTNENDDTPKEVQRLTITIEVSCSSPTNEAFEQESLFKNKQFSASEDMVSNENQLEKEPELIKKIFDTLVEDVVNKSTDNW